MNNKPDFEQERQNQLHYGRQKLTMPTLVTTKGKRVDNKHRTNDKPDYKKAQKTGHEETLAKLIYERKKVKLLFTNDSVLIGEVLQFDNYSIKIRDQSGNEGWWFKSALIGFRPIKDEEE